MRNSFWLAKISQGVVKLIFLSFGFARLAKFLLACENFARGCEIHPQFSKACEIPSWPIRKLTNISQRVVKFLNDRFLLCFSSLHTDWFGKGFEALHNSDFSCTLASILLCHGLYQVLPHSWLFLMIKKLPKTPKLAKNWLVTLTRFLNVPIELKGINYYSKVFKTISFKL